MTPFLEENVQPLKNIWCFHRPFAITMAATIPMQIIAALMYCFFFGIQGIREWEWKTKPIPMMMIILTACAFISFYGTNLLHTCVTLGLILSLAGDIVLMNEGPEEFLVGLGAFFLAHILYIIAFSVPPKKGYPPVAWHWTRAIPFAFIFCIVPPVLASKLVEEENPDSILITAIFAYGLALSLMGWRAAARIGYPKETKSSQCFALIGALFFMASDCLLAFNKFHTPLPYAQVWVLCTYWIGQSLITFSLQRLPWDRKLSEVVEM